MFKRIAVIAVSAFAVLLLGLVLWVAVLVGPPLKIEHLHVGAIVHVETLGEYVTTIRRIQIEEVHSHEIVFEAVAGSEPPPQITNFELRIGTNSTAILQPFGTYRVVYPAGSTFVLTSDRKYRISVWGNGFLPSRDHLQLGSGDKG